MIRLFTLLAFTTCSLLSWSQNIKNIQSDIDEVKLYLTAGEIKRNKEIKLKKGRNKVVFKGISAYVDEQSIQFKGDKNFTIVSISTEMDFFTTQFLNEEVNQLKDSLEFYQRENDKIESERAGINSEINVLNKNQYFGNSTERISIEELGKTADFFKSRIAKANQELKVLGYDFNRNMDEINKYKRQLAELNFKENERSNQIVILIDVENSTTLNAELRYLVSDCGWAPTYELIATSLKDPISLVYKAQVYNNTGNDWSKVKLTLTTNDPGQDASLPVLDRWNVNRSLIRQNLQKGYIAPKQNKRFSNNSRAKSNVAQMNQRAYDTYVLGKKNAQSQGVVSNGSYVYDDQRVRNFQTSIPGSENKVNFSSIQVSQIAVDFPIDYPFSVPSDSRPYTVEIKNHRLEANFSHVAVPKMAKESFLLANIVGWQNLDLIPGKTQVYFGGNYVGNSYLSTENVTDTLKLSFGRDAKVLAHRKLISQTSQNILLSNDKKNVFEFEISLKNNRAENVSLNVFDQIPISVSSEITVEAIEIDGAKLNPKNGELEWMVNLAAGEGKKINISFSVRFPKNQEFKVRSFRTISAPSF